MRSKKLALAALLSLAALAGCHSSPYRDSAYGPTGDPQFSDMGTEKSFVDRHPLLSSPRNYYRDSGDNPVVRVVAGTLVGVPVGVAQELWQIGYGQ